MCSLCLVPWYQLSVAPINLSANECTRRLCTRASSVDYTLWVDRYILAIRTGNVLGWTELGLGDHLSSEQHNASSRNYTTLKRYPAHMGSKGGTIVNNWWSYHKDGFGGTMGGFWKTMLTQFTDAYMRHKRRWVNTRLTKPSLNFNGGLVNSG